MLLRAVVQGREHGRGRRVVRRDRSRGGGVVDQLSVDDLDVLQLGGHRPTLLELPGRSLRRVR